MKKFVKKVLGDPEAKTLKRLRKRVKEVNALEESYKSLSNSALKQKPRSLKNAYKKKMSR
jgi:preprotein translocase subunit SecA